jgi:hypothetical protein
MSFIDFISVIAAGVSIHQAYKASRGATKVEKALSHVKGTRETEDLSTLKSSLNKALNSISKYGPASDSNALKGINVSSDLEDIQEFLMTLNHNKNLFEEDIDKQYKIISDLVEQISNLSPSKVKEMKKMGTQLFHELNAIMGTIKTKMDNYKELKKC